MKKIPMLLIAIFQLCYQSFSHGSPSDSFDTVEQKMVTRFQEPSFPYPYDQEDVIFHNSSANVTLAGTLTLPRSTGPFPVVILLHGSTPMDRNASMFDHKLFLVWADHLTKQGIAVLRFDKRSAGQSTGDYNSSSLEDFADDALAGIEYLKTRKEINFKQIGFIGHSEGGMTALLTTVKSKDVAYIVLMASPCVNWEELILKQEESLMRVDSVSEEFIVQSLKFRKQLFAILKNEKNREIAEPELRKIFVKYFDQLTPAERQIAETYYGPLEFQVQFFNSVWFGYNFGYEPVETLKRIKTPVLALNGELDLVVSPKQNLIKIAKTLDAANHEDHTIIEIPLLNHAFQTCKTGSVRECAEIEETTAPLVLDTMSDWILKRVAK